MILTSPFRSAVDVMRREQEMAPAPLFPSFRRRSKASAAAAESVREGGRRCSRCGGGAREAGVVARGGVSQREQKAVGLVLVEELVWLSNRPLLYTCAATLAAAAILATLTPRAACPPPPTATTLPASQN